MMTGIYIEVGLGFDIYKKIVNNVVILYNYKDVDPGSAEVRFIFRYYINAGNTTIFN